MFHRIIFVIQVWNDTREKMRTFSFFGWTIPLRLSTKIYCWCYNLGIGSLARYLSFLGVADQRFLKPWSYPNNKKIKTGIRDNRLSRETRSWTDLDCDDIASLLKANFKHLSTGSTADLPLTDQIRHLCRVPLKNIHTRGQTLFPHSIPKDYGPVLLTACSSAYRLLALHLYCQVVLKTHSNKLLLKSRGQLFLCLTLLNMHL